ncbi:hypothetical protein L6452_00556 [Arctium lappa]|uniref:Uncharacterized protein n=1 Tax=Arctium lappa TaxID=4217 RepID=A0ACB9FDU4_ARCLA|nr:hypothetical protein L6452_00556 [Arctium lappa]
MYVLVYIIIWNIEEFTIGSSAGLPACTSAGIVPFAVGSETVDSITYPATQCGVTVLRPTFGVVGRTGVLSLSESLVMIAPSLGARFAVLCSVINENCFFFQKDKLGPLCRSAVDCAIVLDVIRVIATGKRMNVLLAGGILHPVGGSSAK